MKIYPDRLMSTVKFIKLSLIETLSGRKENFYLDRAVADQPPDNLLLSKYDAGDTSLLRSKPRGKKVSMH